MCVEDQILLTGGSQGVKDKGTETKKLLPCETTSGSVMEKLLKSLLSAQAPVFSAQDDKVPGISTRQNQTRLSACAIMSCMPSCMRMPR
jgi:hypothetical protein